MLDTPPSSDARRSTRLDIQERSIELRESFDRTDMPAGLTHEGNRGFGHTGRSSDFRARATCEASCSTYLPRLLDLSCGQWRRCGFRSRSQRRGRSGFSPDSLFFRPPRAAGHQRPGVNLSAERRACQGGAVRCVLNRAPPRLARWSGRVSGLSLAGWSARGMGCVLTRYTLSSRRAVRACCSDGCGFATGRT